MTNIADGAFNGCSSLTNVSIPDSVTSIWMGAFYECTGLVSVTLPNSVTSIWDRAFEYCVGLTSVTFETGSNVTTFGWASFPEGSDGVGGDALKTAYEAASPCAGTYTRASGGSIWTKQ
ncbi:MAG: leucine-rich repeat domain-containing protein [Treponematales bacterium]